MITLVKRFMSIVALNEWFLDKQQGSFFVLEIVDIKTHVLEHEEVYFLIYKVDKCSNVEDWN